MNEFNKYVKDMVKVDTVILYHPTRNYRSRDEDVEFAFGIIEDLKDEFEGDDGIQFYTMDCYENELGD